MKEKLKTLIKRIEDDDPDYCVDRGIFCGDLDPKEAALILLPVPWDATTSYGTGAAKAPQAIAKASYQIDLFDPVFGTPYKKGLAILSAGKAAKEIKKLNQEASPLAKRLRSTSQNGAHASQLGKFNQISKRVNELVYKEAQHWLNEGRLVGLIGGEHSCPLGLIRALSEKYKDGFGILHIDAHLDLRPGYEGFLFSHASIMHHVVHEIKNLQKLVQVGMRDFSEDEFETAKSLHNSSSLYLDRDIFLRRAEGENFLHIVHQIVGELPENVYISFDIDGLEPAFCPSTGTPVPGGFSFNEASLLLEELAKSKRRIIGFDLTEVVPSKNGEWDENVGARLLYKLCGAAFL